MELSRGALDYAIHEISLAKPYIKVHAYETIMYHLEKAQSELTNDSNVIRWDILFLLLTKLKAQNSQESPSACSKVSDNFSVVDDDRR